MNQKNVSSLWKFYQTYSSNLHFRITRLEFDNRKILQTNSHNIHSNISGLVTGFQEGETVLKQDTLLLYNPWSEVAQSYPTVCDPMGCSLSGSSIRGIFQARVLEWIAISFSRGSSWPRNRTQVSLIAGRRFTVWATREAQLSSLKWQQPRR